MPWVQILLQTETWGDRKWLRSDFTFQHITGRGVVLQLHSNISREELLYYIERLICCSKQLPRFWQLTIEGAPSFCLSIVLTMIWDFSFACHLKCVTGTLCDHILTWLSIWNDIQMEYICLLNHNFDDFKLFMHDCLFIISVLDDLNL